MPHMTGSGPLASTTIAQANPCLSSGDQPKAPRRASAPRELASQYPRVQVEGALLTVVPIVLAPIVMYVAIRAQRRLGAEAAGWVAAIPTTVPIAVLAVGLQSGNDAAAQLTLSAASHVPAQILYATCFAAMWRRNGTIAGFAAAATAFVAASLVIYVLPNPVAIAAAVVALIVGPRLLESPVRPEVVEEAEQRGPNPVLACSAAAIVVSTILAVVHVTGPLVGGTIAAFPTLSTTIAVTIARSNGRDAGIGALAGLVRGLPCYFAYLMCVAVLAVPIGSVLATVVGFAVSAIVGWTLWVLRRDRVRPVVEV
jgi:hypothetical protein